MTSKDIVLFIPIIMFFASILGIAWYRFIGSERRARYRSVARWITVIFVCSTGFLVIKFITFKVIKFMTNDAEIRRNEKSMIGALKTIAAMETDYNNNSIPHSYATDFAPFVKYLEEPHMETPFWDPDLTTGLMRGYSFELKGGKPIEGTSGPQIWTWSATAWPLIYETTGVRSGYIDETGVLRCENIGGGKGGKELKTIE